MSLPQLTASRLWLAAACPGSFAHEHTVTTSEAAERGSQVHSYIAATLSGERTVFPEDEKAAGLTGRISDADLDAVAMPAGDNETNLHLEAAMYLSPASGAAGLLEGSHHRDYSGAPEGALVGTADVVAVEEDRVRVSDWKTGRGPGSSWEVPDPAANWQLRFLALTAARIFGKDSATVQVARIAGSGEITVRDADLYPQDLEEIARELAELAGRVEAGRNGDPEYRPGPQCRYCPAFSRCPAMAGAAQALMDSSEDGEEELTPRKAAELWKQLQAVEAATKRVREALTEYVYSRPIPTEEGKELKVLTSRREQIDSSRAFTILREYLPGDEAMAEAVTVTKSSLSGALDKERQAEVLAAFKEAGAVSESYSESLREVRS